MDGTTAQSRVQGQPERRTDLYLYKPELCSTAPSGGGGGSSNHSLPPARARPATTPAAAEAAVGFPLLRRANEATIGPASSSSPLDASSASDERASYAAFAPAPSEPPPAAASPLLPPSASLRIKPNSRSTLAPSSSAPSLGNEWDRFFPAGVTPSPPRAAEGGSSSSGFFSLDEWTGFDEVVVPSASARRAQAPVVAAPPPAPTEPLFSSYASAAAAAVAALEEEKVNAAAKLEQQIADEIARLAQEEADAAAAAADKAERTMDNVLSKFGAGKKSKSEGSLEADPDSPAAAARRSSSQEDTQLNLLKLKRGSGEKSMLSPRLIAVFYKEALIKELSSLPTGWATAVAAAGRSKTLPVGVADVARGASKMRQQSSLGGLGVLDQVSSALPTATGRQRWSAMSSVLT